MNPPRYLLLVPALLVLLTMVPLIPAAAQEDTGHRAIFWQPGDPGQRLNLLGRVAGPDGRPLAGATVSLWQADGTGAYRQNRYRGTLRTAPDGSFRLGTVMPGQYYGVKHLHVQVEQPGFATLRTRVVFKGDPYLEETDPDQEVVVLEEVRAEDETILLGGVELIMQPLGDD